MLRIESDDALRMKRAFSSSRRVLSVNVLASLKRCPTLEVGLTPSIRTRVPVVTTVTKAEVAPVGMSASDTTLVETVSVSNPTE
jgi:hypothetical protein